KTIKRDDYSAGVIREIAEWLCDGESLIGIVHKLNERGELTYRDRVRVEQGKPTRSRRRVAYSGIDRELWSAQAIIKMMTSPRLSARCRPRRDGRGRSAAAVLSRRTPCWRPWSARTR